MNVPPPLVLTSHCTVGMGEPLEAAVKEVVPPILIRTFEGLVVTLGIVPTVSFAAEEAAGGVTPLLKKASYSRPFISEVTARDGQCIRCHGVAVNAASGDRRECGTAIAADFPLNGRHGIAGGGRSERCVGAGRDGDGRGLLSDRRCNAHGKHDACEVAVEPTALVYTASNSYVVKDAGVLLMVRVLVVAPLIVAPFNGPLLMLLNELPLLVLYSHWMPETAGLAVKTPRWVLPPATTTPFDGCAVMMGT